MVKLTLNKCLSKLDSISFSCIDECKDGWEIRLILEDVRKYFIYSTTEPKKKYYQRSFMVILEFINYLIQESYKSTTNLFLSHINALRFLLIRFYDDQLHIGDEEIDFDEECYTFLRQMVKDAGYDYGCNDSDYENDDKSED